MAAQLDEITILEEKEEKILISRGE